MLGDGVRRVRGCKQSRAVGPCTAHSAGVVFVPCVGRFAPCTPAPLSPRRTPQAGLEASAYLPAAPDTLLPVPNSVYTLSPHLSPQGQTISAPHMHAMCLEHLAQHLVPGARVLDVGSGSGYLTACMALMVGSQGLVVGVEKVRRRCKHAWSPFSADGRQSGVGEPQGSCAHVFSMCSAAWQAQLFQDGRSLINLRIFGLSVMSGVCVQLPTYLSCHARILCCLQICFLLCRR